MKTLIQRLDEYIEYAEKTKRFADVWFYKELAAELQLNYEALALVDQLCYSMSDEEEKEVVSELIDWQIDQDSDKSGPFDNAKDLIKHLRGED